MSVNSKMKAIADAIRAKTGGTSALTLDGMAEAVAGIEAGGGVEYEVCDVVLAENGTSLSVEHDFDKFWSSGKTATEMATGPDFAVCFSMLGSTTASSSSGHYASFITTTPYSSSAVKIYGWTWVYSKGSYSQYAPYTKNGDVFMTNKYKEVFNFNTNYVAGVVYRCVFFKGVELP